MRASRSSGSPNPTRTKKRRGAFRMLPTPASSRTTSTCDAGRLLHRCPCGIQPAAFRMVQATRQNEGRVAAVRRRRRRRRRAPQHGRKQVIRKDPIYYDLAGKRERAKNEGIKAWIVRKGTDVLSLRRNGTVLGTIAIRVSRDLVYT